MTIKTLFCASALSVVAISGAQAQSKTDWPLFGYDAGGSRFSPLTQITPANVATLKESGLDMPGGSWFGLFAAKGTPAAVVTRMSV